MPRYRRFHPISHDFNRDPQIIEARKQFGDWIGYAWQECLAIADRNEGIVPGTFDQIAGILAPISLRKYSGTSLKTARMLLEYAQKVGWILVFTNHIEIVNYWEYHRRREAKQAPSEPNLTVPNQIKIKRREDNTCVLNSKHDDWPSPKKLVEFYNSEAADELPAIELITDARKKKARAYLSRFPKEEFWHEVFLETRKSRFLRGLNNKNGHDGFSANLDWLLTKGKDGTENCVKVFEGRYRDDKT